MAYLKEEIKAGIIITAAFLLLSGFVILVGGSQTFEKLDPYQVQVKNAAGIEKGAQVKLGGVRVGKVLSVNLPASPGDPVSINIGVTKGTAIYRGTIASISQVGLMGDFYILLSVDAIEKGTTVQYKPGETIPLAEQLQLAQLLARLDRLSQSFDRLIGDVNKIFSDENVNEVGALLRNANTTLKAGTDNFDKVGSALKSAAVKLERALDEVEGLVKDSRTEVSPLLKRTREGVDKAIEMIKAFDEAAQSADKAIMKADGAVDRQSQNLEELLKRADSAIDRQSQNLDELLKGADSAVDRQSQNLDELFKGAGRAIDRQSQNLDELINNLSRTSEDLRETIYEIKSKPWGLIYKEEQVKEE